MFSFSCKTHCIQIHLKGIYLVCTTVDSIGNSQKTTDIVIRCKVHVSNAKTDNMLSEREGDR